MPSDTRLPMTTSSQSRVATHTIGGLGRIVKMQMFPLLERAQRRRCRRRPVRELITRRAGRHHGAMEVSVRLEKTAAPEDGAENDEDDDDDDDPPEHVPYLPVNGVYKSKKWARWRLMAGG